MVSRGQNYLSKMFSSAQLSIGNPGRGICDFYSSLRRILCEFTFRPLYLSTDVHTYRLLSLLALNQSCTVFLLIFSLTGTYPLLKIHNFWILAKSPICQTIHCQQYGHVCVIKAQNCYNFGNLCPFGLTFPHKVENRSSKNQNVC